VTDTDRARVVIADDHPRVLNTATSILARRFDVVASVAHGMAALEATRRLGPDVVVLDLAMPGLDGFQTAARIRMAGSNARIVFLSNHAGDDFVLASVSRGASAFVAKARMERDLVEAVDHAHAGRKFVPSAAVLPRWHRPAGERHDLQLYAADAFLIDAAMGYFESALETGDAIIAIASEPHRRALDAAFRARGFDPATPIATGRYTVEDADAALAGMLRDGMPDPDLYIAQVDPMVQRALSASTGALPHVTVFGEIAPILCRRREFDAMFRLEQIADAYIATRPLSVLCAYSTEFLPDDVIGLASCLCAEHSTIVPADQRP
jgi:DNA-binding NarL/FixJ family response regulator